ncbi:hypothetical protein So717_26050 [Roseobacter cerasinus]|uniref:Uncharacterized protein n=1 Tax=Roseobacter cerasinus TaxID=2602289 RepID=A0A640VT62_9RHOB|nr:hypothetical protein [Roseobacter cerasinus]GFE50852.1 hypothetical protein So717_26050 [Roseobacter cerasinus]
MAEQIKISDLGDAQAWLAQQDEQTRIWFDTRCSLRAFLGIFADGSAHYQDSAFVCLRALLVSVARSTCDINELWRFDKADQTVKKLCQFTQDVITDTGKRHVPLMERSPSLYRLSCALLATKVTDGRALTFDTHAYSSLGIPTDAVFAAASADTATPLGWPKLWAVEQQPHERAMMWDKFKLESSEQGLDWSFWIKWYEPFSMAPRFRGASRSALHVRSPMPNGTKAKLSSEQK